MEEVKANPFVTNREGKREGLLRARRLGLRGRRRSSSEGADELDGFFQGNVSDFEDYACGDGCTGCHRGPFGLQFGLVHLRFAPFALHSINYFASLRQEF